MIRQSKITMTKSAMTPSSSTLSLLTLVYHSKKQRVRRAVSWMPMVVSTVPRMTQSQTRNKTTETLI